MYLLQCLVTCEVVMSYVTCPMTVNVMHIVQTLTKECIFLKISVPSEGHFNIIYNSTFKPYWPYLYKRGSLSVVQS